MYRNLKSKKLFLGSSNAAGIIMLMLCVSVFFLTGCGKEKYGCGDGGDEHEEHAVKSQEKHGDVEEHGEDDEHGSGKSGHVKLSKESEKIIGLTTEKVNYRIIENTLKVTGKIAQDVERMHHVVAGISGEVIGLHASFGDMVKSKQILAEIKTPSSGIKEVFSGFEGMIIGKNISIGSKVDELESLFTIADISTVEANFDVREKDIGKIKVGQRVAATSLAYPDEKFYGEITFISPQVDNRTRTIKVRAAINNPNYLLKFNMFLNGKITVSTKKVLAVPVNALLNSHTGQEVIVYNDEKEYVSVPVAVGDEDDSYVEITKGLKNNDTVVVEGNFLLKSELLKSQLGAGCAD